MSTSSFHQGVIAVPVLASVTVAVPLVATPTMVAGAQATPVVSVRFDAVTVVVVLLAECAETAALQGAGW